MTQPERQLPISVEAEQALLGAVLMNNEAFDKASKLVSTEDFSQIVHARTWDAMETLISAGRPATILNLKVSLQDAVLAEGVTLGQYLARLAGAAATIINATDYARTIRDLAQRRRIIDIAAGAVEQAYAAPLGTVPSLIAAGAIDGLDDIVASANSSSPRVTVERATEEAINRVYAQIRGETRPALRTGIKGIDRRLNGLEPGDLIVLAGRPGMGKSALALQIALNIALRKDRDGDATDGVAFFSLEMMAEQIAHRLISNRCRDLGVKVEYKEIRRAVDLKDNQLEAIEMARRELRGVPIIIEQEAGITLAQISARLRRIKGGLEAQGKKLKCGVVDYLQIIKPARNLSNREREVAEISAGLKAMAKDIGVPIIALSQVSRQVESRKIEDRRPMMSDLRESGAIEQDSDCILGVFREAYYLQEDRSLSDEQRRRVFDVVNDLEVIALKVRQGATGVAKLYCEIGNNYFSDPVQQEMEGLCDEA